ncbi:unnamed protein product, partial [Polarella glacialis]
LREDGGADRVLSQAVFLHQGKHLCSEQGEDWHASVLSGLWCSRWRVLVWLGLRRAHTEHHVLRP